MGKPPPACPQSNWPTVPPPGAFSSSGLGRRFRPVPTRGAPLESSRRLHSSLFPNPPCLRAKQPTRYIHLPSYYKKTIRRQAQH
eukprot:scaffold1690_cov182-Amphora_coffeaeformis.AAC.83